MSMIDDLQGLIDEVKEAREVLAKRVEHEQAAADAERRLAKAQAAHDATLAQHDDLKQKLAEASARFDHEKRRYDLDLASHSRTVEEAKTKLSQNYEADCLQAKRNHQVALASLATEHDARVKDMERLRKEHDHLKSTVADFKRRLGALPE